MQINNEIVNFTDGFNDLHFLEYKNIIGNKGHSLKDSKLGVEITHKIRNQKPIGLKGIITLTQKIKSIIHLITSYDITKVNTAIIVSGYFNPIHKGILSIFKTLKNWQICCL